MLALWHKGIVEEGLHISSNPSGPLTSKFVLSEVVPPVNVRPLLLGLILDKIAAPEIPRASLNGKE